MRRAFRVVLIATAVVMVAGTIASASQPFGRMLGLEGPSGASGASGASGGSGVSGAPMVTGPSGASGGSGASGTTGPLEGAPVEGAPAEDPDATHDFSVCEGLHGLENAICRHEVLLASRPDHPGLANSLDRLRANLEKHGGEASPEDPEASGAHPGHGHGHDGGHPGNGNANGHGHGHDGGHPGNGNANGHGH